MCRRSLRVLRGPSCAAGCLIEKQREGGKTSSEEIEPRRDETLAEGEKVWAALFHSLLRRDAKDYLFVSLHAFSRARAAWCLAWPRALVIGFNVRMFKDDPACALRGGRRRPWDNERGYLWPIRLTSAAFFVFDTVLRKLVGQLWLEGTVTVLDPFVWACCRLAARRLQIYTAFIFCLALSVVSIPCGFRSVPVPVGSGASGDKKEWTSVWSSCRERQAQRTKRAKAREAEGVWKEDQVRLCLPNSGFYRSNKLTSYFEIT